MWLLPSKGRPELLNRFFESARKTKMSTPGVVILDKSDKRFQEYAQIPLPSWWSFYICPDNDPEEPTPCFGKSIRSWMKNKSCCEEWLGILNDDFVCVTPEWDKILIKDLNGRNFVSCNDRYMAPQRAAGPCVWSLELIKAVGFLFPPKLHHLYVDDVWERIGEQTSCWDIRMDVIVEHWHDTNKRSHDETDEYRDKFYTEDKQIAIDWFVGNFESTCDRIRRIK